MMDSDDEDSTGDELQPRTSMRPTPAPFYNAPFQPSVPEVSLLFGNAPQHDNVATSNTATTIKNKTADKQPPTEFESYNAWKYKNIIGGCRSVQQQHQQQQQQQRKSNISPGDGDDSIENSPKFNRRPSSPPDHRGKNRSPSDRNDGPRHVPFFTPEAVCVQRTRPDNRSHGYGDVGNSPRMAPLQPVGYPGGEQQFGNVRHFNEPSSRVPNRGGSNSPPCSWGERHLSFTPNDLLAKNPINVARRSNSNEYDPRGDLGQPYLTGEMIRAGCDVVDHPFENVRRFDESPQNFPHSRNLAPQPPYVDERYNRPHVHQICNPTRPTNYRGNVDLPSSHGCCNCDGGGGLYQSNSCHRNTVDSNRITNFIASPPQYVNNAHSINAHVNQADLLVLRNPIARSDLDLDRHRNTDPAQVLHNDTCGSSREIGTRNKKSTANAVSDLCRIVQLQNEQLQILQSQVAQLLKYQLGVSADRRCNELEQFEHPNDAQRRRRPNDANSRRNAKALNPANLDYVNREDPDVGGDPPYANNVRHSWDKVGGQSERRGGGAVANDFGAVVQKVSIGVMTSYVDPSYFDKNGSTKQRLNEMHEARRRAAAGAGGGGGDHGQRNDFRVLGARPKEYKNQQEARSNRAAAEAGSNQHETQPKQVWKQDVHLAELQRNDTRQNDVRHNDARQNDARRNVQPRQGETEEWQNDPRQHDGRQNDSRRNVQPRPEQNDGRQNDVRQNLQPREGGDDTAWPQDGAAAAAHLPLARDAASGSDTNRNRTRNHAATTQGHNVQPPVDRCDQATQSDVVPPRNAAPATNNALPSPGQQQQQQQQRGYQQQPQRQKQFNDYPAESPANVLGDIPRTTPMSDYATLVDESVTMNGINVGPFPERPLTPDSPIQIDIQDYKSSDDEQGDERDDDPEGERESPDRGDAGRVGWTFYNNVVGQVNEILQSSPVQLRNDVDSPPVDSHRQVVRHPSDVGRRPFSNAAADADTAERLTNRLRDGDSEELRPTLIGPGQDRRQQRANNRETNAPSNGRKRDNGEGAGRWPGEERGGGDAVRDATMEQLRQMGVSVYDQEGDVNCAGDAGKKVTFDSVYYNLPRMDFLRVQNTDAEPTDVSMRMNALAMKYLKDDQINEYARLTGAVNNLQDVTVYNVATKTTNMSFATMRYLERYQLLPPTEDRLARSSNLQAQGRVQIREEPIVQQPFRVNELYANSNQQPYEGDRYRDNHYEPPMDNSAPRGNHYQEPMENNGPRGNRYQQPTETNEPTGNHYEQPMENNRPRGNHYEQPMENNRPRGNHYEQPIENNRPRGNHYEQPMENNRPRGRNQQPMENNGPRDNHYQQQPMENNGPWGNRHQQLNADYGPRPNHYQQQPVEGGGPRRVQNQAAADVNGQRGNHCQQEKAPNKILDITALKQQPKLI